MAAKRLFTDRFHTASIAAERNGSPFKLLSPEQALRGSFQYCDDWERLGSHLRPIIMASSNRRRSLSPGNKPFPTSRALGKDYNSQACLQGNASPGIRKSYCRRRCLRCGLCPHPANPLPPSDFRVKLSSPRRRLRYGVCRKSKEPSTPPAAQSGHVTHPWPCQLISAKPWRSSTLGGDGVSSRQSF